MGENPYAPPQKTGESPAPEAEGITFNDYDLERVSKATTWMRRVSSLQYFLGSVLALLAIFLVVIGGAHVLRSQASLIVLGILVGNILLLLLGAFWLRQSCIAFYEGVMSNAELGLALGFRKLRLYLLLYGLYGLVGLAGMILKMVR
jgi:hypothetical protein